MTARQALDGDVFSGALSGAFVVFRDHFAQRAKVAAAYREMAAEPAAASDLRALAGDVDRLDASDAARTLSARLRNLATLIDRHGYPSAPRP